MVVSSVGPEGYTINQLTLFRLPAIAPFIRLVATREHIPRKPWEKKDRTAKAVFSIQELAALTASFLTVDEFLQFTYCCATLMLLRCNVYLMDPNTIGPSFVRLRDAEGRPVQSVLRLIEVSRVRRSHDVNENHSRLSGHSLAVMCAAFSPDGKTLVTGSWDHTAKVWHVKSGVELLTLCHSNRVNCVAFSHDGKTIVTGSRDCTIRVWCARSGYILLTLRYSHHVNSIAFSPDSKTIVAGSFDGTTKVWDAKSGATLLTLFPSPQANCVAFSPDGKTIVTGSGDYGETRSECPAVNVWDAKSGAKLLTLQHSDRVNCVAFSPDGKTIVTGSRHTATVWDTKLGAILLTLQHSRWINCVAFSPDGKIIVTGSDDRNAKLWNAITGKLIYTITDKYERKNEKDTFYFYYAHLFSAIHIPKRIAENEKSCCCYIM